MGEKLSHDNARVAPGDAARLGSRGHQIHELFHCRSLRTIPDKQFEHCRQFARCVPLVDHSLEFARHRRHDATRNKPLQANRSNWRSQAMQLKRSSDLAEVTVSEL